MTAQNTLGVSLVDEVASATVTAQIDAVFADAVPDAVKVGMLPSAGCVRAVAAALCAHGARNVVVDPVMASTTGTELGSGDGVRASAELLLPSAVLVTPNIPETRVLCDVVLGERRPVDTPEDAERAARDLAAALGCAVLVKGGHARGDPDDVLAGPGGPVTWLGGERVDNPNAHGTGCTLSSAIACGLAQGHTLADAVRLAKAYLTGCLRAGLDMGMGAGPMDHFWWPRELGALGPGE